jgi:hypothetical protein
MAASSSPSRGAIRMAKWEIPELTDLFKKTIMTEDDRRAYHDRGWLTGNLVSFIPEVDVPTIGASEGSPFLLIWVLFSTVAVSSAVLLISLFRGVDLPIIPSSWCPLASRLQKLSPGFGSFYAYISDREQIVHHFELLHCYLFHSFKIADAIMEGVNNLDVLNIQDVISGIAETLDIIMETLIMLLLDGLEGLGGRWTLIGALKVPDEHGTQLISGVNGSFG